MKILRKGFLQPSGSRTPWVCSSCLSKLQLQRPRVSLQATERFEHSSTEATPARRARLTGPTQRRNYQTRTQARAAALDTVHDQTEALYLDVSLNERRPDSTVRKHLREWQQEHGTQNVDLPPAFSSITTSAIVNDSMRTEAPGVPPAEPEDGLSQETDNAFTASDNGENLSLQYMSPGDLIAWRNLQREVEIGIFVKGFDTSIQVFMMSGKWAHINDRNVVFTVPGYLDPALLSKITPYLPRQEMIGDLIRRAAAQHVDIGVPREAAAEILDKLTTFWNDSEAVYRLNAATLDNAYRRLAHPTDLKFGMLEKIAKTLVGKGANDAALLAVCRALVRDTGFTFHRQSVRYTRLFTIQPKDLMQDYADAADWIRQYQDFQAKEASAGEHTRHGTEHRERLPLPVLHVERFVQHARALIQRSREIRPSNNLDIVSPSLVQHPSSGDSDGFRLLPASAFSKTDQVLIRFLKGVSLSRDLLDNKQLASLAVVIYKAVKSYPEDTEVDAAAILKMLMEIGVIKPYENRHLCDQHLLLPSSDASKPLQQMRDRTNHDGEGLKFEDSMHDLRHDWGDLQVYCIDSLGAETLDDGISIERVTGKSGEWWVRVHVANPTALMGTFHLVMKMAAHTTGTFYAPDEHFSLIPEWITQQFLSLAPGRPVLTFSARVDEDGHVLEYDVRPGTIRKVQRLSQPDVSSCLGLPEDSPIDMVLTVGKYADLIFDQVGGGGAESGLEGLTQSQKDDIRSLLALAQSRQRLRARDFAGLQMVSTPKPSVNVKYNNRLAGVKVSQLPNRTDRAHFMEGDPVIQMRTEPFTGYVDSMEKSVGETLVEECMLLAGNIAARWGAERSIPFMYMGTLESSRLSDQVQAADFFKAHLQPRLQDRSKIPFHLSQALSRLLGTGGVSLSPLEQTSLGMDMYAKVTTPLGRYGDMIAHWQIESAIREEARTGSSLVGSDREDYLTFTRAGLAPVVTRLRARQQLLSNTKEHCKQHWMFMLLFRAFNFGEAELPATMTFIVNLRQPFSAFATGMLKELNLPAQADLPHEHTVPPSSGGLFARPGDHWEVQLTSVSVYPRVINLEPLRLLHREPCHVRDLLSKSSSHLAV